jgi:recombinational DNA repair ATPase RecF
MIKVESIRIEEFRGIRDLTMTLNRKNFSVCGPNGTGKSGVVDALEFGLTGNISRLSGEGTDNISVKEHAPHVDSRNAPEKAKVTIKATIPSLGKTVTITRTVKAPNAPVISPADPATVAVLKQLERHPEFVLTRRELIRYVLSPPGKRAREVQALLRLDRVEQARETLQKVANRCRKNVEAATETRDRARDNLARVLGIPAVNSQEVLKAANNQRSILELPPITELTASTSLKEGVLVAPGVKIPGRLVKSEAIADLTKLRADLVACSGADIKAQIAAAVEMLESLSANESLLLKMAKEGFYRTGLDLIDGNACPLCDTEWDPVRLRSHIEEKLARLADVARQRAEAEKKVRPIIAMLNKVKDGIDAALRCGTMASPAIDTAPLREFRTSTESSLRELEDLLPLSASIAALRSVGAISPSVDDSLKKVEVFVASVPEPAKQDAARDFLTIAQERLETYREASLAVKKAQAQAELARTAFDTYARVSREVLEGLYRTVEENFAALYREINRDDESGFTARLIPSLGKLGFDVDFYGRGHFPPGAYHSEGHQDGMGLCLYLALMKHLQGADFTFAVLDDVLMSVDSGHRREVCALLKKQFPNTQFILTTHDPIWLRHMKTEALLGPKASIQFRGWHVDHGPTEWDDRDVWEEINDDLAKNDVRAAAALLRYYLEYIAGEMCHRLRASVEFRGDLQYQLGDTLPRATARLKDLYEKGKRAAASWSQADVVKSIGAAAETFAGLVAASNVEQWQINPAVHYNEWVSLQKADFVPVAAAFKKLVDAFRCPECGAYIHVVPERGKGETLRCDCGKTSINLLEKGKT